MNAHPPFKIQNRKSAFAFPVLSMAIAIIGAVVPPASAEQPKLSFRAEGKGFSFDTGSLLGTLRLRGKSLGLMPMVESVSGVPIAKARGFGLLSHYRLLDADARYGTAAWDWPSESRLLADGSVETRWSADAEHPFDMNAVYRLAAPDTFDVVTTVTARKKLRRFEVFLASYFEAFEAAFIYVKACSETGGKNGFLQAKKSRGDWQIYPRDGAAGTIGDGRWKRPPSPVNWSVGPALAAPLAMRRHAKTGLVALLMAPADECFAVSTPHDKDPHCSLYLSLLGRDLETGRPAMARARLIVARGISDERAVALYETYLKGLQNEK